MVAVERFEVGGGWRGLVGADVAESVRAGIAGVVADPNGAGGRVDFKVSETVAVFGCRVGDGDDGVDVICKQSAQTGVRGKLAGVVRGSRERRNWERALRLVGDGIATANPVAYVERGGLAREGWLITERIDGVVDLERVLGGLVVGVERGRRRVVMDGVVEAMATLFEQLVAKGWRHRDLKASNVLLTGWDAGVDRCKAWVVDLDGLERAGSVSARDERRMVVRLAASLSGAAGLGRADRLRFLKQVCRGDWKDVWREVQGAVAVYNEKARRRKGGKVDAY